MTPTLTVRAMELAEVELRIDYFHDATDEYLRGLGVDRELLPTRDAWRAFCEADFAQPLSERENYLLAWEADGDVLGFSSADHIDFGNEAFMHLHVLDPLRRRMGFGAAFVRLSVERYFTDLELDRLYCEPNALNVAPNRTLQRAGFRYLFSHETTPGPINYPQTTTRWVIDRTT